MTVGEQANTVRAAQAVSSRQAVPAQATAGSGFSATLTTGLLVAAAGIGVGAAHVFHVHDVYESSGYLYAVTALLAIGIYASTSGIDLTQLRNTVHTVVLAITVGVLAKSVLIAALVLPLLHGDRLFAVILGVAVAQIDPLAVAALVGRSRLSESGKAVLRAWSAFDDPVTMLLTVYLLSFASRQNGGGLIGSPAAGTRLAGFAVSIGENLLFAGVLFAVWLAVRALRRRERWATALESRYAKAVAALFLLAAGYVAVTHFLLFGLALVGLFWRPRMQRALDWTARAALGLATVALGMVLADGVWWSAGAVLGGGAFAAQLVVAPIVAFRQRGDRIHLGLAQQNGITAITLALLLQPFYPDAVAVVGPAVLVVNVLHTVANGTWSLAADRRKRAPVSVPRPSAVPLVEPSH